MYLYFRGNVTLLKCLRMDENACILSYYLPSCSSTRQSVLLYNGESSHCEHYRLPSICGNVSSYHSFYNLNNCFATTSATDGQYLCHLWQVKLNTNSKLNEERIDVRKTILPIEILQSLQNLKAQDYPATIIAYEVK